MGQKEAIIKPKDFYEEGHVMGELEKKNDASFTGRKNNDNENLDGRDSA